MRALVLTADTFGIQTVNDPIAAAGSVRVAVTAAALNRRDQWIREGRYPGIALPAVLGSDGCGTTDDGRRVVIDPSMLWGDDARAQGRQFHIVGMPTQGTLAEYICVPMENVHDAPRHLSDEQVAALPVAGVTAYRAVCVRGAVQKGETVLITGIGGGVATMALTMALAAGAQVYVTSGSTAKIEKAVALGARGGVLYTDEDWATQLNAMAGPIDLAIDSAGGDGLNGITAAMRPGGRVVMYGATRGPVPSMNVHRVFWKQLTIMGSTMGTAQDFADMLRYVSAHGIVPIVDSVTPFADVTTAFDKMAMADQFGKVVVTLR